MRTVPVNVIIPADKPDFPGIPKRERGAGLRALLRGTPQAGPDPLGHLLQEHRRDGAGTGRLVLERQLFGPDIYHRGPSRVAAYPAA